MGLKESPIPPKTFPEGEQEDQPGFLGNFLTKIRKFRLIFRTTFNEDLLDIRKEEECLSGMIEELKKKYPKYSYIKVKRSNGDLERTIIIGYDEKHIHVPVLSSSHEWFHISLIPVEEVDELNPDGLTFPKKASKLKYPEGSTVNIKYKDGFEDCPQESEIIEGKVSDVSPDGLYVCVKFTLPGLRSSIIIRWYPSISLDRTNPQPETAKSSE